MTGGEARNGGGGGLAEDRLFRLGEAPYGPEDGQVGLLNLMAFSGIAVGEGVILARECHRRFMEASGLAAELHERAGTGEDLRRQAATLRRRFGRRPSDEETRRVVRDAVIALGARTVAVISDRFERAGVRSIPEAQEAVAHAWLTPEVLARQLEAAARGEELPVWPVLIRREQRAL